MDSSVKDMDDFSIHWGVWTRRFPSDCPVQTIGYLRRKKNWIRTTFNSCNFSFILSGRGQYAVAGKLWTVEAPCVLTQWPGVRFEYGPGDGAKWWEELFLIFHAETLDRLRRSGFLNPQKPCWQIANPTAWQETLKE